MNSFTGIYQDFDLLPYFETLGTVVFLSTLNDCFRKTRELYVQSNMSLPESFLNLADNYHFTSIYLLIRFWQKPSINVFKIAFKLF